MLPDSAGATAVMARQRQNFTVARTPSGKACLNLACGTKTHDVCTNLDFSPYARLRKHMWLARLLKASGLLSETRWRRLKSVSPGIILWDLHQGIPFPDGTFDVVYHSHFLEHLPRDAAEPFFAECFRVCKTDGLIRAVVPDLETLARRYLSALEGIGAGRDDAWSDYDAALHELFDQVVRDKAVGATEQRGLIARIEPLLRGGPDRIGERHKWMYDGLSLKRVLEAVGFRDIRREAFDTSRLSDWSLYKLDLNPDGSEYKPGSLYVEASKPA